MRKEPMISQSDAQTRGGEEEAEQSQLEAIQASGPEVGWRGCDGEEKSANQKQAIGPTNFLPRNPGHRHRFEMIRSGQKRRPFPTAGFQTITDSGAADDLPCLNFNQFQRDGTIAQTLENASPISAVTRIPPI